MKEKGGAWELLLPWLVENNLHHLLRDYENPATVKKVKTADDSSGSSPKTYDDVMCKLRGWRNPELDDIALATVEEVAAYFVLERHLFDQRENGVLKAGNVPLLKVDVPLDLKGKPDLLRLVLPGDFSLQKLADRVLTLLQVERKCVFAAAMSGAGKTRLIFDLAHRHFALYFDMNGGHGKVKQMDVGRFITRCGDCAVYGKTIDREDALKAVDHVIATLFLSRWAVLTIARHCKPDLTPADWLWLQTDNSELCTAAFDTFCVYRTICRSSCLRR